MKFEQAMKALAAAGRRAHVVGDAGAGVIAALDVEGRLFPVWGGEILTRINPEALAGQSTRDRYINPGGDGLWPAPEGTTLGYQYAAGAWRVPPGLVAARYRVLDSSPRGATLCAEVDLVNNRGVGIPVLFQRRIAVSAGTSSLTMRVVESLTYTGRGALRRDACRLAPWTLCQFDCGPGCEVVFPCARKAWVWDLYDTPSDGQRVWDGSLCRTRTDGSQRYQIALGAAVPWIEYRDPRRGIAARRRSQPLPAGQSWIDIRDAAPDLAPSRKGVRYSVYSDPAGFMEIEAVGGCPAVLRPGVELSVEVNTRFERI
jgi:hypothetical protein